MVGFTKEADFENALITALQRNGWEQEVLQYPTEDDLIDNWAEILFENVYAYVEGTPIHTCEL